MYFVYQKQINVASERNYNVDYYTKCLKELKNDRFNMA